MIRVIESTHPKTPKPDVVGIAAILGKKVWHSDGAPSWPRANTKAEAAALTKKWVKRLRRKDKRWPPPTPAMLALADILVACVPGARCRSGCCPVCGRAFQRWAVAQVLRLVAS